MKQPQTRMGPLVKVSRRKMSRKGTEKPEIIREHSVHTME